MKPCISSRRGPDTSPLSGEGAILGDIDIPGQIHGRYTCRGRPTQVTRHGVVASEYQFCSNLIAISS